MFNCSTSLLFSLNNNVFYLVILAGYESDDNAEIYTIRVFFSEFRYLHNPRELYKKRLMFKFTLCFLTTKSIDS